jgi:hypothetical protein
LFTIGHLQDLLSHNSMTNDEVMCLFTDLLSQSIPGVTYIKPYFSHYLVNEGWQHAKRYLASDVTSPRRRYNRPSITGEAKILIPFFVNTNHWVAISRHECNGTISFLYADDLNSRSTELRVKKLLTNTDHFFYPPNAKWITCTNTTYEPHANECGPRTLLALTAMAFSTHPNRYILNHLMHPNLAQISRVWVAASILNTCINNHPFIQPCQKYIIHSQRSTAWQSSLLTWGTNSPLGQHSQDHTAAVPNHTQGNSTAPPPTTADGPSHTTYKQKTSPHIITRRQQKSTYHDLTSSKAQTSPLQTHAKEQPTTPPTK